jgi:hypothetical protein
MDKAEYNGSWFICPVNVDGRHDDPEDSDSVSGEVVEDASRHESEGIHVTRPIIVSLLEIARPVKAKGNMSTTAHRALLTTIRAAASRDRKGL